MASSNDVKEEAFDERHEAASDSHAEEEPAADASENEQQEGSADSPAAEGAPAEAEPNGNEEAEDIEIEDADMDVEGPEEGNEPENGAASKAAEYDPLFDQTLLKPLFERREKSLKELLESMDEFAPIIPDAVTDYYLARSGLKTNDQRIKRLLALATQKFISDIASDAYQYSRIRSQAGGTAGSTGRGRGGQGSTSAGRTVLTMESLGGILGDYGINTKRPDFYR